MSYLPPVGWADVATKHDLDAHRAAMQQDLALLGASIESKLDRIRAEVHQELTSQLRWVLGSTTTAMVVLTGLFAITVGVLS